jgi:polysaccharide biosynthesis transport protein
MADNERAGWQPEIDVDYGQRLVGFLLVKYRWLMLGSAVALALVTFFISLYLAPTFRADGTIVVDKALSSSSSLLTGLLSPMGGGNTALESEKQVLVSREIAKQVMDELGLRVAIADPLSPDAARTRLLKYMHLLKRPKFTREELYSKLTLEDVVVNPELQVKAHYTLKTAKSGAVAIGGKRFEPGQRIELGAVSFIPRYGAAHVPGQSYKLTVYPLGQSFQNWREDMGVTPVNDKANVLRISFSSTNPFISKRVVELVTQKYFQRYNSKASADYDGILAYISGEIAKTKQISDELTAELTKYREEHKVFEPSAQGQAAMAQIADLSRSLTENRVQQQSVSSALKAISSRTPEEVYDLIQAPATELPLESSLMMSLATQLNALQQARQTKTDAHPEVRQINASIKVLIEQIKDSLSSTYTQLKFGEKEFQTNLSELKGSLQGLPEAEGKLALAMAELDANGEIMKVLATSEAQTKLKQASTTTDVQTLDSPVAADKPESPRPLFNAALGGIVGLILAILLGLMLEVADPRIRTLREIRLGLGLPVLGVLPGPAFRKRKWRPLVRDEELLSRLSFFLQTRGRMLNLVHPLGAEGGYDAAWGLAGAAAGAGKPALLIDADRLGGGLAPALEKTPPAGLSDVVSGQTEIDKALLTLSEDRRLLGLGDAALSKTALEAHMIALRERFATVLVCLPAPQRWVDQGELASLADDTLIVLPQHAVVREELAQVLTNLRQRGIEPRGVIITHYAAQRDVLGRNELRQVAVGNGS